MGDPDARMVELSAAAYEASSRHGRLSWAARYDDDGRLIEGVYADENGRLDIPTSGQWLLGYETAGPVAPALRPRTEEKDDE